MTPWAFISRHEPTKEQFKLAYEKGIELSWVGDMDAFTVDPDDVKEHFPDEVWLNWEDFDGVIVVHPAAALRLERHYKIGVFENANRAPEGERPQFYAKALHFFQ